MKTRITQFKNSNQAGISLNWTEACRQTKLSKKTLCCFPCLLSHACTNIWHTCTYVCENKNVLKKKCENERWMKLFTCASVDSVIFSSMRQHMIVFHSFSFNNCVHYSIWIFGMVFHLNFIFLSGFANAHIRIPRQVYTPKKNLYKTAMKFIRSPNFRSFYKVLLNILSLRSINFWRNAQNFQKMWKIKETSTIVFWLLVARK